MSKRCIVVLLLLLPLCCLGQNNVLVIKNVAIIDVIDNKVTKDRLVVIEGNRIVSLDEKASIPAQATILEGRGKYLIPGLWDMHTHSLRKGRLQYFFPLFIANGVTGIRDMASDMGLAEIDHIRDEIQSSKILGPRLGAVTGRILDGPPQPDTLLFTYPANIDAAEEIVRSYKQQKADFIKVYNTLGKGIYLAIAGESKKLNIPFEGHVPFSSTAAEASNLGQRSIEHLSDILISVSSKEVEIRKELTISATAIQGTIKRMQASFKATETYDDEKAAALFSIFLRNETWQCPTLRNLQIFSSGANLTRLLNDSRLKYFPGSLKETWKKALPARIVGDSLQRAMFFKQSLKLVADMQRAGVKILAGTDLANPFLMPGFSLHDELELMVEAGLSPFEALQTATINPAKFLQKDKDLGSVEKGKIADLILLDANPLESISNTKKIYSVIVNGKFLSRTDVDNLLMQVEGDVSFVK
ncbi:amidohydrolase family protein [Chitinophaga agrisoli]|uniref:Amidohydrolase family protein n=1 Tax=Chitinophaga agrisoli TaxID=2607653 RepID=A0A5B2VX41_9BACT|nr:amidohydrolase family protein [Chitinophaga agrisoli]KAA2242766.1 amidohydrolase family protein [Chitinophaga agrisoli]